LNCSRQEQYDNLVTGVTLLLLGVDFRFRCSLSAGRAEYRTLHFNQQINEDSLTAMFSKQQ
jgi:hypothetical protein